MGYHDNRHSQLLLQFLHQFQYLRLNGNIQSSSRFISDQDIRFTCQRHGDHDTLTHTAGKFVRILLYTLFRFIHAHKGEHFHGTRFRLFAFSVRMKLNRFPKLVAHGEYGIQAGHGILENNGAAFSAELPHLLF